jgi:hypothetical protein
MNKSVRSVLAVQVPRIEHGRVFSPPSRGSSPCASLSLHLHQVVKRTFTSKLSNMYGVQRKPGAAERSRFLFVKAVLEVHAQPELYLARGIALSAKNSPGSWID